MAKDPAVLWYWSDWFGGTMTLSRHLKGCYMDLLYAQFNSGPLSLEEIKIVLGSDFGPAWPAIQKKFKQTDTGLFFNERMEAEKQKRIEFSKKQAFNGKKGGRPSSEKPKQNPTLNPNETLLENENRNENVNHDCFYSEERTKEIFYSDHKLEMEVIKNRGCFTVEQFRSWCKIEKRFEAPNSKRAFGGVVLRAAKEKLIFKDGYAQTESPTAHGAIAALWRIPQTKLLAA